jgi:DNA modification methylase
MTDNLDPLRNIEGFPLGKDEDLHALSNPPYYTAYPNPHIADFIKQYGKPYDEAEDDYRSEPFVADVSESKNDPIYNAHSYHTKVPYKAIVPFIEHYTQPGEIVFDGFCGTGMTGVAAQIVGRRVILCDLSPAATFIAGNYNFPVDVQKFEDDAKRILKSVQEECAWLYQTKSPDGNLVTVNYTVWSDVFVCSYCNSELIFWDLAVDQELGKVHATFSCPKCHAEVKKRELKHAQVVEFDKTLGKEIEKAVQVPVLINYSIGKKNYDKRPDKDDLELLSKIKKLEIPYWYPTTRIDKDIDIWYERDYRSLGIYSVDSFFTKRNLWVLSCLYENIIKSDNPFLLHAFTGVVQGLSRLQRFRPKSTFPNMILSGTLYVGSLTREWNVINWFDGKLSGLRRSLPFRSTNNSFARVTTQSGTNIDSILDNTIDYIFTDPPFGSNIIYSDLNILWESWLKVFTNTNQEAVVHRRKKDGAVTLDGYRDLMLLCFKEMYRILKPGRWITVEFHNSKASVWNAIQESLARAGFIVAQVTVLDKQQESFKQITAPGAVENDLVINAYKPHAGFTQRLISQAGRGLEADFVREHLRQLPVAANVERSQEMLYSKYLAYYVQHGYQVAYNGEQFYRTLSQWGLEERDGYWYADENQAHEYEQRKVKTFGKKGAAPQAVLFVSDERSARQWIWNFLDEPKTYDEIYTKFIPALQTSEDAIPELKTLLEESFIRANGHWKRPDQLTQAELEQKRLERLLRQFNEYLEAAQAGQKVKEVRREAVLAGFTECYREGRFQDIITLGRKLDKRLLEESPDLFDFLDIAGAKIE